MSFIAGCHRFNGFMNRNAFPSFAFRAASTPMLTRDKLALRAGHTYHTIVTLAISHHCRSPICTAALARSTNAMGGKYTQYTRTCVPPAT